MGYVMCWPWHKERADLRCGDQVPAKHRRGFHNAVWHLQLVIKHGLLENPSSSYSSSIIVPWKIIINHIDTWIDEHFPGTSEGNTGYPGPRSQSLKAASFVGGSQQIGKSIGRHGTAKGQRRATSWWQFWGWFMTPGDIASDTSLPSGNLLHS